MTSKKDDFFSQIKNLGNFTQNPARQFTRRYIIALVLTAVLFFISYTFLWIILDRQSYYTSQVNVVGQQNKVSQEIAKNILTLKTCESIDDCERHLDYLEVLGKRFEKLQNRLLKGDTLLKSFGMKNKKLEDIHARNQYFFYPILDATEELIKLKKKYFDLKRKDYWIPKKLSNKIIIYSGKILVKEQEFTKITSQMSNQYNAEAKAYIAEMRFWQIVLLAGALLTLLLEALLIFQPVVRKIKAYLRDIQKSNKVAYEKNQEMKEAYERLQKVEEKTRRNAKELEKSHNELLAAQEEITEAHEELKRKNEALKETYNLRNTNKKLEESSFLDAALNHFTEVMRWDTNQNVYDWSEQLLAELVPYVGGLQGIIYAYETDKKALFATGSYALEQERFVSKNEVNIGEDLVGQVAKSLKPIYLNTLNGQTKNYTTNSGTETILAQSLAVLPLVFNENIAGVLEISFTKPIDRKYADLLDKISTSIASNLSTLQDQKHINQLFADSQMARKRLQKSLKKIQENEERFRKLAEVTQEGLIFVNNKLIVDTNPVLVKMMGYEQASELKEKSYTDLIAPKYRIEFEKENFLANGLSQETLAIHKNGNTFPIEIQARRVNFNNEQLDVISIQDITEKKKTEQELAEANRIASLVSELEKKNKDITSSIEYAKRIQHAILPSEKLIGKGFLQNFVLYIPKDIVSGDFYWFAEKNEHALIAAVDCTGHGVPGAFMSIIGYSNLNKIVLEQGITQPDEVLNCLDAEVTEVLKQKDGNSRSRDGMDVGLCSLNIFEKELSYAGAYRPMYLIRNGELTQYKGNSFPIGGNFKFKKEKIFTKHTLKLQEGDTLYIFSDGYPDQFGGKDNRKYMTKRFKEFLVNIQDHHLEDQKQLLRFEFEQWKGDYKQMDDILIIGLRF